MTLDDIRECVRAISEDYAGDDEAQHYYEDDLYVRLLIFLSGHASMYRGDEIENMCSEAIKAHDIDFCRWCA